MASFGLPVSSPIPLGLYLHFPWCVSKCPYCDFNSHALRADWLEAAYVEALCVDLEQQLTTRQALLGSRSIETVFMGGGTPSLFSPESIERVLVSARRWLPFAADVEITLEANPGTIEHGRFAEYAAIGINRISLGAQSFDAGALRRLGRVHSPADTCRAVDELRAAGLANFNLDLMYGLPGQDVEGALRDVRQALALAPAQISHYQLTLEPGTVFAAQPPAGLPGDDRCWEMLERCAERLSTAGYERYEVSAYAQPGRRCAHNLLYWGFGDYLGVGAGAHGKLSGLQSASGELAIWRSTQQRDPRRYQRDPAAGLVWQMVEPAQRPFEFMLNALRLVEGFDMRQFESRTGLPWQTVAPIIARQSASGWLESSAAGSVRPSVRGLQFLNELLLDYLSLGPSTAMHSGGKFAPGPDSRQFL